MKNLSILVVDHDRTLVKEIVEKLRGEFPKILLKKAYSVSEAEDKLLNGDPCILITCIEFPDNSSGLNLIKNAMKNQLANRVETIVIETRAIHKKYHDELINFDYVAKSIRYPSLVNKINEVILKIKNQDLETQEIKHGEMLYSEGQQCKTLYVVKEGRLGVYQTIEGKQVLTKELTEKDLVGELALLTNSPRISSVIAMEDSILYKIDLEQIENYLEHQPLWIKLIFVSLVEKLHETSRKLIHYQSKVA